MRDDLISPRNRTWLRNSELNPVVDAYINYLSHYGYSEQSIRTYSHSVAHFAYWLTKKKAPLGSIDEATISQFLHQHLPVCDCSRRCRRSFFSVRAALGHLLKVLRVEGKISPAAPAFAGPLGEEIARYEAYLKEVRGLAKSTRISRMRYVRAFLLHQFGRQAIAMERVEPSNITRFITLSSEGFKPASAQVIAGSVRSYLRFRAFVGDRTEPLIAAAPSVAQWRLATVPKALSPAEVERVLNAFDRTTAIGQRDYAMVRCLTDLGLRASEVAHLQIDDVNWRAGTLRIKGAKGLRIQLLPLPIQTGEAIVDYLRHGRPATRRRTLFVRHHGPVDYPVGTGIVSGAIRRACVRCNLNSGIGTHVLRHTAACRMLQAGATIKEIADVLRHRSLDTTMIYAKVDLVRLSRVAAPWPGQSS